MTPHSPAFAAALAAVSALLGAPSSVDPGAAPFCGYLRSVAVWRRDGAALELDVRGVRSVVLRAEGVPAGRSWVGAGEATIRDAAALLGWTVPS